MKVGVGDRGGLGEETRLVGTCGDDVLSLFGVGLQMWNGGKNKEREGASALDGHHLNEINNNQPIVGCDNNG